MKVISIKSLITVNIYTGPVSTTGRFDHSSTYKFRLSESDVENFSKYKCVFSSYIYTLQVFLYFNCHLCMCFL